jgi:hypothetical protein
VRDKLTRKRLAAGRLAISARRAPMKRLAQGSAATFVFTLSRAIVNAGATGFRYGS